MNLYELSRNNLKTINVHLKEVGGYNYHKIQTPFGLAQAKNLPQGLDIVWPEMKLRCHLGFNHLKFTDMNNTMEKMGQILLAFDNSDIYLDELGQSFDEKHRVNIMDFVKNLSSEYSQMFMISHYHNGHGIFTNAQITILDDSNLRKIVNGGLNGYDEVRSVYIKAMKLL